MTPNTQITQANVGPGGYLVKDFADGWYWTPNAALECTSGALVWSVSDSRYETEPDRPALSPPAEGDSDPIYADGGVSMPDDLCIFTATPTPAPVDWERVGPKLVEAIDPADMDAIGLWINEGEQPGLVPSGRIKALWQAIRAALAAAQPEGK